MSASSVNRVDDPELRFVAHRAGQNFAHHRADFVADARRVEPRRRDDPEKRVQALAHGRFHDVVDRSRLVGVKLVDAGEVRVQAVKGRALGRLRLKGRVRPRHVKRIGQNLEAEALAQVFVRNAHLLGIAEDDLRLIARRREGIDLRARLSISQETVERHPARQARFPVPAWHFDVDATKPASAVRAAAPPEYGRQYPHLPRLELDPLPGKRALRVRQELDELAHPIAFGRREGVEARPLVALTIRLISTKRLVNELARGNLPGEHILRVLRSNQAVVLRGH